MKSVTRRKGAFVRYEDGEWGFDTKVKVNGVFLHFKKKGYACLSHARADFEKAKAEFIKERSGAVNANAEYLFDNLLTDYENMRSHVVSESTILGDMSIAHVDFLPAFGGKPIKDCFNQSEIEKWQSKMMFDHFSKDRQAKAIARMKDLLKYAYTHKKIDAVTYQDCDVALLTIKATRRSAERVVWTLEEEKAFMAAIDDGRDSAMFATFLACGARLGEVLGLQPKCIDWGKGRLVIKQQAIAVAGKGTLLTDKLKTKDSYRTVAIPSEIVKRLAAHIVDNGLGEDDFLFFDRDKKTPMSRTTFRRKLYAYCDKAGVRRINPHASRHMQATRLASVCKNGQEIEAAARRLGHSPEMFMNTYAKHADEATEETLLGRLAEANHK
jgi:integrase